MPTQHPIRRRHSPSQPWGLWRVLDHASRVVGYLITTMDRYPQPIRFVENFESALLVHQHADCFNVRRKLRRKFIGKTLLPIDSKGRHINRQTFVCGRYNEDGTFGLGTRFMLSMMGV